MQVFIKVLSEINVNISNEIIFSDTYLSVNSQIFMKPLGVHLLCI